MFVRSYDIFFRRFAGEISARSQRMLVCGQAGHIPPYVLFITIDQRQRQLCGRHGDSWENLCIIKGDWFLI